MIVFDLACPNDHVFEGWFASAADFEAQKARSLVRCPVCDHAEVAKRPSAVSLRITPESRVVAASRGRGEDGRRDDDSRRGDDDPRPGHDARAPREGAHASDAADASVGHVSPEVEEARREIIARMRELVRATEDVGQRFAEEARRIHYDEAPKRSIRGQASREEADALREEGIDFLALPPLLVDEVH